MTAPTKPSWYWFRYLDGNIGCAKVELTKGGELFMLRHGWEDERALDDPENFLGEWLGEAIPPTDHENWCDRTCDCGTAERKPRSAP